MNKIMEKSLGVSFMIFFWQLCCELVGFRDMNKEWILVIFSMKSESYRRVVRTTVLTWGGDCEKKMYSFKKESAANKSPLSVVLCLNRSEQPIYVGAESFIPEYPGERTCHYSLYLSKENILQLPLVQARSWERTCIFDFNSIKSERADRPKF